MVRWIRGWSIAAKLFALQLVMIVALATVAVAWIWADARADVERDAAAKSLAVAETLAADPFVGTALGTSDPSSRLQPYALDVMDEAGVDFVTIMAPDRIRFTHPDPEQIGQEFLGNIDRALAGDAFTETYTGTLGPSVRAVVPVEADDGEVIALVAVGVTVSNTQVALGARIATVVLAALAMIGVGAIIAWLLSRYLRRVTWGRGAEEMSRMFSYYEGVLHSIGEGLVLQDRSNAVVLYNDRAAELLALPRRDRERRIGGEAPVPLTELDLPPAVAEVLSRTEAVVDEIAITPTHVLVIDRDVIVSRDRERERGPGGGRIGSVTTLRDHTELQELTGELETMTTLSDALRSQAHEFANRLHTIIALIELDRAADAAALASSELALSQALADRLLSAVEEPVLLALLLGKAAQASERGIAFEIELPDRLEATSVPARDLITIVGNLIDNALDAAAATPAPRVEVAVELNLGADELRIAVGDSGSGPDAGDRVFDLGVTTKQAAGHGIGLALVRQTVTRLGGGIRVQGSTFEVTLPTARASSPVPGGDRDA
ncbi:ATP-binding protein [Agromyces ramosus]|uniref:histidine kinase n=1 Tax=Agromyces ramosus TaxID=33879 RepID=A0ABU0R3X6_9MICO|nr:ATP-binding protein [Agromyces ramosus]MDQ0892773.1 two-component system CitB family sensor kinase [Agromyces ramosus]